MLRLGRHAPRSGRTPEGAGPTRRGRAPLRRPHAALVPCAARWRCGEVTRWSSALEHAPDASKGDGTYSSCKALSTNLGGQECCVAGVRQRRINERISFIGIWIYVVSKKLRDKKVTVPSTQWSKRAALGGEEVMNRGGRCRWPRAGGGGGGLAFPCQTRAMVDLGEGGIVQDK